jgi:hypothetical protein
MPQQVGSSTEGNARASFLVSEANGYRSREKVTIVSGQNLKAGAVIAKITASGKYKDHDVVTPASDGSQLTTGLAILYDNVDATGGDVVATAIVRDAEVNAAELVWRASTSGGQITTATTALATTNGIQAR